MRVILVLWVLLVACAAAAAATEPRSTDPVDEYLGIYQSIQRADELLQRADVAGARSAYEAAKTELEGFAMRHPGWNERVVQYRRGYIAQQLGALPGAGRETGSAATAEKMQGSAEADEAGTQLSLLREQLRRMSVENETLYSRLQEALSARPSAVDPQELERADERIRSLQKENELLKVALDKAERPSAGGADRSLEQELADQRARNEILMAEKRILESHVAELASRQEAEIRARTEELDRQLAAVHTDAQRKEAEVARLETEVRSLRERSAEQDRLNQDLQAEVRGLRSATAISAAEPAVKDLLARVRVLEQERDELRRQVESVQAGAGARTGALTRGAAASGLEPQAGGDQTVQVALLARALSRRVEDAETDALVARAQSAATAGRWADAEAAYRQALRRTGRDLALLSGLGATLLAQNRVAEAESNFQAVVAARPQDPTAVLMLGVVRVRQRRDDEALMLLSRAAQIDPSSAEAHCFLGQVLGRKGLTDAAEKTLLRAVDLRPHYAEAHRALARHYAVRQPPSLDLARRHHALAMEGGASADPQVEELLRSGAGRSPAPLR